MTNKDQDLAKALFMRNINVTAFPRLVKLLEKGTKDHMVTDMELDEAVAALATTKLMYEYMVELHRVLVLAHKLDMPMGGDK